MRFCGKAIEGFIFSVCCKCQALHYLSVIVDALVCVDHDLVAFQECRAVPLLQDLKELRRALLVR